MTQPQTDTIRVAFDVNAGIEPQTFAADATHDQITERLREAFLAAGAIDKGHEFVVVIGDELGTVKVLADGNVIEYGSITRIDEQPATGRTPTPGPSYFAAVDELQESIRELMSRCIDDPRGYIALVAAKSGGLAYEQRKLAAAGAESKPIETDPRRRLAAELRRIALDIVTRQLPIGSFASLRLGVVDSRADLDPWAAYLGTTIDAPDSTDIPSVTARIELGGGKYGPELSIGIQSPKEEQSELKRLRAENALLQARLAEGGATR
ncbi:hypothetical protein OHB44_27855 [Micromonospora sp. NBC_00821]|uniref:hypothetical protein n=1 Tax=Micromonospora sp. NBC_00821 TaxID=2975977 RepID=UPI002ED2E2E4|nr:hypothetical protein OHB44_27855 [Micromonospora sp. NBC_00821]